jgi:hypothetical protein
MPAMASVRANVTIDWTVRENVRAQLRVLVKRILRKHGYPPDKQERRRRPSWSRRRFCPQNGRQREVPEMPQGGRAGMNRPRGALPLRRASPPSPKEGKKVQ